MQSSRRPQTSMACFVRSLTRQFGTTSRPRRKMPLGFFSESPLLAQTRIPAFNHTSLRRAFSNTRSSPNPFQQYQSARTAIIGFIGINSAVFIAWQYAAMQQNRGLLKWMSDNFILTLQTLREGRYHIMLTSALSHHSLTHFAFNMMTFYAFGNILTLVGIGGSTIISLCVGSALAGSAAFYYQHMYHSAIAAGALGASGVVMGMGAAATCLMPFAPMQIMFIPVGIPLWVITLAYAGLDTYYLHDARSRVGHAAHLGGSIYGVMFYAFFLRRYGGIANMFRGISRR